MGGMAGLSDEQHKLFEARLKRISRGGPNTSGHVIVGPVEPDKAPRRQRIRRPGDFISRLAGAIRHLLVVPISFALGAAAMMAGIVGGHQVDRAGLPEFAQAGILQEVVAYQEFVIAGLVVLVLGWTLRLTRGPRKIAVVTGLAAAFVLQDQIVATYPDTFARLMPDTPLVLPEIPEIAALTED
jgi:hypothetical protein